MPPPGIIATISFWRFWDGTLHLARGFESKSTLGYISRLNHGLVID
jgi:hypothetical protein